MIKLFKKNIQIKNKIFFQSTIGNINIFFIDKKIQLPNTINIQIKNRNKIINIVGPLGALSIKLINNIFLLKKKNQLILNFFFQKKKKDLLNLYIKLIRIKMKGVLQGFKINLILKGIGFKALIEKNILNLKLGYSHVISINIPENIQIINQSNILIFNSIDYIYLTQFVHFIKSHKKPEPYKGKGLLLKNEKIIKKEGKKSKK